MEVGLEDLNKPLWYRPMIEVVFHSPLVEFSMLVAPIEKPSDR